MTKLDIDNLLVRQAGLISPKETNSHVAVYGVGAVGSWVALILNKMGFENMTLYDFDTVDEANLGPQLFSKDDLGKPKVVAFLDNPYLLTHSAMGIKTKIMSANPYASIHLLAVDSMKARKAIFDSIPNGQIVCDSRMGNINGQLLAFVKNAETTAMWEETWFPDNEAEVLPCTEKATAFNAAMMGAMMARAVFNLLTNKHFTWHDHVFGLDFMSQESLHTAQIVPEEINEAVSV